MVYLVNTMRFKRTYQTHEVTQKLNVEIKTAWKWGDNGTLGMVRQGKYRLFNADEVDFLAPRMMKERLPGMSPLPANWGKLKKKFR